MKTHNMTLDAPYFNSVSQKLKKYELRIFDKKRQLICLGDIINFKKKDSNQSVNCLVSRVLLFDDFKTALTIFPLDEVLPGISNVDEALKIYTDFYSNDLTENGVVMFKLSLIE